MRASLNRLKSIRLLIAGAFVSAMTLTFPLLVGAEIGAGYALCKLQKEVRTLRTQKKGDKCVAIYTKSGKDRIEGEALNPSSCEDVVSRIRGTLEKAGWKCRDVKGATLSELNETVE